MLKTSRRFDRGYAAAVLTPAGRSVIIVVGLRKLKDYQAVCQKRWQIKLLNLRYEKNWYKQYLSAIIGNAKKKMVESLGNYQDDVLERCYQKHPVMLNRPHHHYIVWVSRRLTDAMKAGY